MKKILLSVLLFLSLGTAFAASDNSIYDGLSSAQIAELRARAAELKQDNTPSAVNKVVGVSNAAAEMTSKWADVSLAISNGIVSTASKLGVEANNFASTPLGKLTTYLIIWNFLGKSVIAILVGLMVMIMGPGLAYFLWNKLTITGVEYETVPNFLRIPRRKLKAFNRVDGDSFHFFAVSVVMIVTSIVSISVGASLIIHAV